VLAAAGHLDMNDNPPFPAGMDGVFCVASSNGDGKASKFNPRFADKDVEKFAALGENVKVSCLRKGNSVGTLHNTTETRSGSSVEVAVAAGITAHLLQYLHQSTDRPSGRAVSAAMKALFFNISELSTGCAYHILLPWALFNESPEPTRRAGDREPQLPGRLDHPYDSLDELVHLYQSITLPRSILKARRTH